MATLTRETVSKDYLESLLKQAAKVQPDCAGVECWGGIYRTASAWDHAARFNPATVRDHARCKAAIRTIIADLQSRYDLPARTV